MLSELSKIGCVYPQNGECPTSCPTYELGVAARALREQVIAAAQAVADVARQDGSFADLSSLQTAVARAQAIASGRQPARPPDLSQIQTSALPGLLGQHLALQNKAEWVERRRLNTGFSLCHLGRPNPALVPPLRQNP